MDHSTIVNRKKVQVQRNPCDLEIANYWTHSAPAFSSGARSRQGPAKKNTSSKPRSRVNLMELLRVIQGMHSKIQITIQSIHLRQGWKPSCGQANEIVLLLHGWGKQFLGFMSRLYYEVGEKAGDLKVKLSAKVVKQRKYNQNESTWCRSHVVWNSFTLRAERQDFHYCTCHTCRRSTDARNYSRLCRRLRMTSVR